jgi:hypothetical protein
MNLHRNNAAEWVMWACLLPVLALVAAISKLKRSVHEVHE